MRRTAQCEHVECLDVGLVPAINGDPFFFTYPKFGRGDERIFLNPHSGCFGILLAAVLTGTLLYAGIGRLLV